MQVDYEEIRQIIQNLCMMNNRFLNKMLDENIEAAEIFLRVIMKDDTIKVVDVGIQRFIQNLYGHSAQLDILAQDGLGRYFNVEVQRSDEGAPVRRARYYSSVLDTHFLKPGVDYKELPDSYVIFITENDVLNKNLPLYNIRRIIEEDGTAFGDGSHIIYVNSKIQDDTALGRLMQDMYCTDPEKLNYKEFAGRMKALKYNKEDEEKMTDLIEEYAQKFAKQVAEQVAEKVAKEASEKTAAETNYKKSVEFAQSLIADGMSVEFAAKHSKLSLDEVRKLAEKRSA